MRYRLASVNGNDGQFEANYPTALAVRDDADPAEVDALLDDFESLCATDDGSVAAREITRLRAMTAHGRDGEDANTEITAMVYMEDLSEYPPDIIVAACKACRDRDKWFPAWADLKAECDKRARGRRDILDALRRSYRDRRP
jgi:hypothetical protein